MGAWDLGNPLAAQNPIFQKLGHGTLLCSETETRVDCGKEMGASTHSWFASAQLICVTAQEIWTPVRSKRCWGRGCACSLRTTG